MCFGVSLPEKEYKTPRTPTLIAEEGGYSRKNHGRTCDARRLLKATKLVLSSKENS
ncbi:hypothetical protein DPMN_113580 [Dreissena polymorpha]|uniref:Uncharacterized protein n=1 Tax=Dreissena polymorpha TaxID=45954 RepID=A0A9D4QQT4_DREPO|nr:hypothetical protein DPMN_113580 [Dreissena polymorpha]